MIAAKKAGLKSFDAWAHHPYPGSPAQTPTTKPKYGFIGLGNIQTLINEVTKLWGRKPIWIYQTKPGAGAGGRSLELRSPPMKG